MSLAPVRYLYRVGSELRDGVVLSVIRCRECNAPAPDFPRPGREPEDIKHASNCWLRDVPTRVRCH